MKRIICFILCLIFVLPVISSCNESYKDDVSVEKLASAVTDSITVSAEYVDDDYLNVYFPGIADLISDKKVCLSNATDNINQFGIFHAKDGNADKVKSICDGYLSKMKERWGTGNMYIPAEVSKLDNAETFVIGNYVIYTIMNTDDKNTVINALKELLK